MRPALGGRFPLAAADFLLGIAGVYRAEGFVHLQMLGRQRAASRRHRGQALLRVFAQNQTPADQLFGINHGIVRAVKLRIKIELVQIL